MELKNQPRLYSVVVPMKTVPDLRPEWSKSEPVFRRKRRKNIPFGAAHTYIVYLGEDLSSKTSKISLLMMAIQLSTLKNVASLTSILAYFAILKGIRYIFALH